VTEPRAKTSRTGTLLVLAAVIGGLIILGRLTPPADEPASAHVVAQAAETYRLMHTIGNDESEVARGLSKAECDARKRERIDVSEALGIHNERLGVGSIACLPESFFVE